MLSSSGQLFLSVAQKNNCINLPSFLKINFASILEFGVLKALSVTSLEHVQALNLW